MPVEIGLQPDGRSIRLVATGDVSGTELVDATEAFFTSHREPFARCRTWLSDYSDATPTDVEVSSLKRLAEMCVIAARFNPHLAVAIVAPTDLHFSLARMWSALADGTGWETKVFRSEGQAERWLSERASAG